jgi:hypothetical protein
MNIDDILKKPEFKKLDEHLTNQMKDTAGEELLKKMVFALGSERTARGWFYSNNIRYGRFITRP